MKKHTFLLLAFFLCAPLLAADIAWVGWSPNAFKRAKSEKKLVLLDLGAVWCHWCHVMEKTTYKDPRVIDLLKKHYVAIQVDQDAEPDLSVRYEDYGWPATILFDAEGKELAKFSGYISPDEMASMLAAFVADPTPGPSVTGRRKADTQLPTADLEKKFLERYYENYDSSEGGWGRGHKFLNWHCAEFALSKATEDNDDRSRKMAVQTLDAQRNLIDPVWGGVYQYSTGGNWKEPHFEKIMQMQAENLRVYSRAHALFPDKGYRDAALSIAKYMKDFLTSPQGVFYVSQDADVVRGKHSEAYFSKSDKERRKEGIPRVDKNNYARENGWAINALATAYAYLGDEKFLDSALTAAKWVEKNRALKGGGFRHSKKDPAGPYLGDSLYMGRAFLTLAMVTGDRAWLNKARRTADFIEKNFRHPDAGYITSASKRLANLDAVRQIEENAFLTRFFNLLEHYTRDARYGKAASHGTKFLVGPVATDRFVPADTLLVLRELDKDPVHITVVGAKNNKEARKLYRAAIAIGPTYKLIEWYDPKEGPIPGATVKFPPLERPAAFACSGSRCSLPAFSAEDIAARLSSLNAVSKR
ncbi:MAG: DUF255 domain-containing protein [Bdellovibrionota bacterium]